MSKPKFSVQESWDNSGDVDVWFIEGISNNLEEKVASQLNEELARLRPQEKSVFHVERAVEKIIDGMHRGGNLIKNRKNKWAWAESVYAVCK